MRQNESCAGLSGRTSGAPNLLGPHRSRLPERRGPALSFRGGLCEVNPIPKPRLPYACRRPNPLVLSRFRCKRV